MVSFRVNGVVSTSINSSPARRRNASAAAAASYARGTRNVRPATDVAFARM